MPLHHNLLQLFQPMAWGCTERPKRQTRVLGLCKRFWERFKKWVIFKGSEECSSSLYRPECKITPKICWRGVKPTNDLLIAFHSTGLAPLSSSLYMLLQKDLHIFRRSTHCGCLTWLSPPCSKIKSNPLILTQHQRPWNTSTHPALLWSGLEIRGAVTVSVKCTKMYIITRYNDSLHLSGRSSWLRPAERAGASCSGRTLSTACCQYHLLKVFKLFQTTVYFLSWECNQCADKLQEAVALSITHQQQIERLPQPLPKPGGWQWLLDLVFNCPLRAQNHSKPLGSHFGCW